MNEETINEFKSIDTFYLALLSFVTFGLYLSYWYYTIIKGIKNTRKDNLLIIACYLLLIFTIFGFFVNILKRIQENEFYNEVNIIVGVYSILYFPTYLFFIFRARSFFNNLLEINKQSKFYFKIIWSLLFGPLYINFNINKIKGTEK